MWRWLLKCCWLQDCRLWILCMVFTSPYSLVVLWVLFLWVLQQEPFPLCVRAGSQSESALEDLDASTSEETKRVFTCPISSWFLGDNLSIFQKPTLRGSCSEEWLHRIHLWSYSRVTCQQRYKEKYCKLPVFKVLCLLQNVYYHQFMSWYNTILSWLWMLNSSNDDDIPEIKKYEAQKIWGWTLPVRYT